MSGAAPDAAPRRGPAWFVAGTDTEIGKTLASCALLHALRRRHARVVGAKPVAAGLDADGVNDDVRRLRAASTLRVDAALDNPYALPLPASPHLAAAAAGTRIELERIADAVDALRTAADAVIVEGVGGFLVPLTDTHDGGDLARRLALPVILVVGLRLGCLNHALLSAEAVAARGLPLAGWIGSAVDPAMTLRDANVDTLRARLDAPCLGVIPHLPLPASPHLAAAAAGTRIELERIAAAVDALRASADALIVEGVGGFLVPLTDTLDGGDLAQRLALPVILVVGLRLGCLNHALLSAEAVAARGLRLAGWIGSAVDPAMTLREANVDTLRARLRAPCLGVIPHLDAADPEQAAAYLSTPSWPPH